VRKHVATYHGVASDRKELTLYPHTYNYDLVQAHQADLREEVAQHRLAQQVRTARQVPPQPRGAALLDRCIGVIARLRAMVVV
jgi:hypothetical protein